MTSPAEPIRFPLTPAAHQARTQAATTDWRGGALARAAERQDTQLAQAQGIGQSRSDQWCNCQASDLASGPWHPLGDTAYCPLIEQARAAKEDRS